MLINMLLNYNYAMRLTLRYVTKLAIQLNKKLYTLNIVPA